MLTDENIKLLQDFYKYLYDYPTRIRFHKTQRPHKKRYKNITVEGYLKEIYASVRNVGWKLEKAGAPEHIMVQYKELRLAISRCCTRMMNANSHRVSTRELCRLCHKLRAMFYRYAFGEVWVDRMIGNMENATYALGDPDNRVFLEVDNTPFGMLISVYYDNPNFDNIIETIATSSQILLDRDHRDNLARIVTKFGGRITKV